MLISVFSPKGGSGTSTCSALISKCLSFLGPTLLVETIQGDLQAIIGVDESPQYTFQDWKRSAQPTPDTLKRISTYVISDLDFVSGWVEGELQDSPELDDAKTAQIVDSLASFSGNSVVDCGLANERLQLEIVQASDIVIMVLRQCYLGLFNAMRHDLKGKIDACIVVSESGRSISVSQIAQTLGVPAVIEIDARRDFARSIDAGVLLHRTPEKMIAPIQAYLDDFMVDKYEHDFRSNSMTDSEQRNSLEFWGEETYSNSAQKMKTSALSKYAAHATSMLREPR